MSLLRGYLGYLAYCAKRPVLTLWLALVTRVSSPVGGAAGELKAEPIPFAPAGGGEGHIEPGEEAGAGRTINCCVGKGWQFLT